MCSGASCTTFSLVMQKTGSYKKHLDSLLQRPKERENNTFRRWASLCSTFISSPNSLFRGISTVWICGASSCFCKPSNPAAFPITSPPPVGLEGFPVWSLRPLPSCSFFLSGPWLRGGSGGVWPWTGSGSLGQRLYLRPQPQGQPLGVQPAPLADHVKPCTKSNFLQRLGRRATGACGCGYRRRPGRPLMVRSPSRHWPGLIFLDEGALKLLVQVSPTK